MESKAKKPRKPANTLEETRAFLFMLRESGVMEFSNGDISVKLLPKAVEHAMVDEMNSSGLLGETASRQAGSITDYDKDLFWSR